MPRKALRACNGIAGGEGAVWGGNEVKSVAQDVVGLLGDGVGGGEVVEGLVKNLVEVTRRGSVTQHFTCIEVGGEREVGEETVACKDLSLYVQLYLRELVEDPRPLLFLEEGGWPRLRFEEAAVESLRLPPAAPLPPRAAGVPRPAAAPRPCCAWRPAAGLCPAGARWCWRF